MLHRLQLRRLILSALLGLTTSSLTACGPFGTPFVYAAPSFYGISVPIPPPSLTAAPVQKVDIDGSLNLMDPVPETLVYLYEHRSDKGYFVFADDMGEFVFEGLELDLSDNCMQVWFEEPGEDGKLSEDGFYRANIAEDDQSVDVEELKLGCS